MAEIAIKLYHPGDERSAQLVDDNLQVRAIIRQLLLRLDLPQELNYELWRADTGQILSVSRTLRDAGVRAGSELRLTIIRDKWLKMLLDKLKREAREYLEDQLWDLAQDKLEEVLRLEPEDAEARQLMRELPIRSPRPRPRPGSGGYQAVPEGAPEVPASETAASGGGGGCFLVIVLAVGIGLAAENWDAIVDWYEWNVKPVPEVPDAVGTVSAKEDGLIEVVDHNAALDFAYQLYLNGKPVGEMRNPKGGTSRYPVTFKPGENRIELKYLDDNGAVDTRLEIRVNGGEFSQEFQDLNPARRISFEWVLKAERR